MAEVLGLGRLFRRTEKQIFTEPILAEIEEEIDSEYEHTREHAYGNKNITSMWLGFHYIEFLLCAVARERWEQPDVPLSNGCCQGGMQGALALVHGESTCSNISTNSRGCDLHF